ncbi:MAG TPA: alkyl sulfatase dimerization domain-containing protein [Candidatus Binatia bacterium]|nr:alkyl sulfatase dimerization domain-containing protein [Candidatus Binatia bacterium]
MRHVPTLLFLAMLAACHRDSAPVAADADAQGHTAPTAATVAHNAEVAKDPALADPQDEADATRGLIASDPNLVIAGAGGQPVWDMPSYDFVKGDAPQSVNPSLWRQAKLDNLHGLFEVVPGVWQLRGYDISNMTIIAGATGWIVVDPLTARETAARAMAFARAHLEPKPVVAVIYTHSHVDHFGGVLGVIGEQDAAARKVRIVAPAGFAEEATSENIIAGTAMARRSMYMYGKRLARSPRGHVDTGLGKSPAYGSVGLLEPTERVERTGQELTVDGVRLVFQSVPASEAPAEMNLYLPSMKALLCAEIAVRTLHNLYTLRGAKVRDAQRWAGYLDEIPRLFPEAEVYFSSHTWPVWGRERVQRFFETQRDTYKYIHDQSVRMALDGGTPNEIAQELKLPPELQRELSSHGYYGTVSHNAKAVYQFYFGWYDGNPANLDPLPPVAAAKKYVEFMGGADAVLQKARKSFDAGEYRWTAQVLNHVVFAEPGNAAAKELLARTYDQLGYQAESAPWRDVYLTGAFELRHGEPDKGIDLATTLDLLRHTPVTRFLDAMAVRLKGPEAAGQDLTVNLVFTDLGESHVLNVKNAVLHHHPGRDPNAGATLALTHELYLKMLTGQAGLKDTLMSDDLKVTGSRLELVKFFSLFEKPDGRFPIVTP